MKYTILAQSDSVSQQRAEEYVNRLRRRTSIPNCDIVNADTRRGRELVSLYGVTSYPAMVVTHGGNGSVVRMWNGQLPSLDEITPQFIA